MRFATRLHQYLLVLLTLFAWSASPAIAEESPQERIRRSVQEFLAEQSKPLGDEVKIDVGKVLDNPRNQSCTQWQSSLPPGVRAWGRVTVAVRCLAGSNASFYVSAQVKVFGSYVVVARQVQGGQILVAEDLRLEKGELSAQLPDVLTRAEDAFGLATRQALSPRQSLRRSQLVSKPAVSAGQTVKLVARGSGFAVSYEGQAINTAAPGQLVRVRLADGKIINGLAREEGVVEVATQ